MTRRPAGSTSLAVLAATSGVLVAATTWTALTGDRERALDLGAAGATVALLTVLLAAVRRPPHVVVRVVADELTVGFHGWDVLWSLRREMRIPLAQVTSVTVYRLESLWSGWWRRRLGTVVPGVIKAGWFAGVGGRELWDVREGADVIDVRLAAACPTSRLVLQVPDPAAVARALSAAVRGV